jgi:hypothetical protein
MTDLILDEYVKVTRIIENIQNKINRYKKNVKENIENSRNEHEQEKKIKEFKKTMSRIKGDKDITQQYRLLKKKQKELRDKLIPDTLSFTDADSFISDLRIKYERVVTLQVDEDDFLNAKLETFRSLQNTRFETLLQEVQKNLKNTI